MWDILRRLPDGIIPQSLRGRDDERRGARLVIASTAALACWAPVFAVLYVSAGAPAAAAVVAIATPPCAVVTLLLLRAPRPVASASVWLAAALWGILTGVSVLTGGLDAPALGWLVAVPVLATLLTGSRAGVGFALLVIVEYAVFYAIGPIPETALSGDGESVLRLVAAVGLTILLVSLATLYEGFKRRAVKRLRAANERLEREVEQHRRTQRRLRQAEQLEALGRLASIIGHEINNPLSYVVGNLCFVKEELDALDGMLPAEQVEALRALLEDIETGVQRIRSTVQDVRRFSRFRAEGQPAPVDVEQGVRAAIKMASHTLRHRARVVEAFRPVPPVFGCAGQLDLVFLNLLLDFAQGLPDGDTDRHEILVLVSAAGDEVVVEIRHTALPGAQCDAGSPFSTAAESRTDGLGMSVCEDIVRDHGGRILHWRDPEQSATAVKIVLPGWSAAEVEDEPSGSESLGPLRILVVDDDVHVLAFLQAALEAHQVATTSSGRKGVELAAAGEYDVVLCDLMMPDLPGMDVYERVSQLRPELSEKFLLMTGGACTTPARAFLDSSGLPVLEKPLDLGRLRSMLARLVRRERLVRA